MIKANFLSSNSLTSSAIIIDGMAVVHELNVHKGHIGNCQDLSSFFVRANDNKSVGNREA